MSISLNELLHYDYFKSLELIAGAGGVLPAGPWVQHSGLRDGP